MSSIEHISIFSLLLVSTLFIFFFFYLPMSNTIISNTDCLKKKSVDVFDSYSSYSEGTLPHTAFDKATLNKSRKLRFDGKDVFVFLHIQKVGGSYFGLQLVTNLDVYPPCERLPRLHRWSCLTRNGRNWIFSRYSTGWPCGIHADWTELTECVDNAMKSLEIGVRTQRRYHYITILRDPVNRFLSEWHHTQRGATWKGARLACNGRQATLTEVPRCYQNETWAGVTLDEFLACKHNLAFNRMTRMLANLSLVNCYNRTGMNESKVDEILLSSAKENLMGFAFFGFLDDPRKTQFLFETTFIGLKFKNNFVTEQDVVSGLSISQISMDKVKEGNKLDVQLYQFARDLFEQRVEFMMRILGTSIEEYFRRKNYTDLA